MRGGRHPLPAMTSLPPGPSGPSIVNLARWVLQPFAMLEACAREYGDYFTVELPGMPRNVVFTDPAAVRDLFTASPEDAAVGEIAGILAPVMGARSVMLIDGKAHQRERRRMLPPFRGNCIRSYGTTIQHAARAMVDGWKLDASLDMLPALQRVTLDIIVRITLGDAPGMREVVARFLEAGTSPLATALLWATPRTRIDALVYRPVRERAFGAWLPWAHVVQAQDAMDELIHREIAARRRAPEQGATDLLSLLMAARDDEGQGMSDEELRDQIVTLLLAGHETTATTLAWTVAHLLEQPALWARTRERVRGLDLAAIVKDEWLEAVLQESMRLSPVALTVGRHLRAPMKLGRWDLPAGVNAIACVHLAQRRADLFDDPLRFSPDRFLAAADGEAVKTSPYRFFPFGGGARRCIGMGLAYFEMKIVLAEIVARTDLAPLQQLPPRPVRTGVTFAPEKGLPVHVRAHREVAA
jgi:cytochrome P450 family 110